MGARTKELRLAKIGDLDRDEWTLVVRHPKGEGTWGDEHRTPVLPQARPLLSRYLKERNRMVSEHAPLNEALFPAIQDKEDGYFSTKSLEKLENIVRDEVGNKLDLRTCRRTFGQLLLDRGSAWITVYRRIVSKRALMMRKPEFPHALPSVAGGVALHYPLPSPVRNKSPVVSPILRY